LPFCQEQGIGVIVYSPMMSGLLTGSMTPERILSLPSSDWRSRHPEFLEPRLSRNVALVTVLYEIGKQYEKSPGEVAIAWTLRHPAVTAAIVGGRRPDQVERIIGAPDLHLSEADLARINDFLERYP
jgi:aryl-alcohol dehydrogenase-like predicted oxidoreductase